MNKLPSNEITFEFNKKGKNSGVLYAGNFTYKRLTIGSQNKAAVYTATMNGDLKNLDTTTRSINEMLGWLRYGLIDYPEWWSDSEYGLDLYDVDIVQELYNKVMKFEMNWIKKLKDGTDSTRKNSDNTDTGSKQ